MGATPTIPTSFETDSGTAIPVLNVLEIAGGTGINSSGSGNTVTINIDSPVTVANGGTGLTSITSGGVLVGNGTGALTVLAQPTNGQLIIGSTGTSPVLSTLTAGAGITVTNSAGGITIATTGGAVGVDSITPNSGTNPVVADGAGLVAIVGSGSVTTVGSLNTLTIQLTGITENALLIGAASSNITNVGPLTNGQLLVGSTGAAPVAAALTAGAGIAITNAAGAITVSATAGGFTWNVVTGATQALAAQNGYIGNRASNITYTLPTTAAVGDNIQITNFGVGRTVIAQNAGESINYVASTTTVGVGGSLTAVEQFNSIELLCIVADTTWIVLDATGNWTVV